MFPRHGTLVAYLALFVALGGTSYAALKLPKNSVGTKQLKKSSVTSAKVKNGTLTASDLKAGTLTAGPKGDAGAKGDPGPKGDPGERGPAGTVDTANFYDKAAADSRFAQGEVTFTPVRTVVTAESTGLLGLPARSGPALGSIEITCANPATSGSVRIKAPADRSLNYIVNAGGSSGSVGNSGVLSPGGSSTGIPFGAGSHFTVSAASGSAESTIDFDVAGAIGGENVCTARGVVRASSF